MSERKKQIILFIFSGGFFLTGNWMIYSEKLWPAIAVFGLAASLILVAAVGPDSIRTFGISWEKGKLHIGFDRYKPTEQERELALKFAEDKPSPEIEKEGQKFIKKAEERTPEQRSPEDYLALATEKWRAKDYEAALADVYTGLSLEPINIRTKATLIHRKGSIFCHLGLNDQGIKNYKEAIKLDTGFSWPHTNLGNIFVAQGKLKEAEGEYKKAIGLDPQTAKTRNNLGNIYNMLGKLKEAEAEFKKAIELDPQNANTHNNLGVFYMGQGNLEEAKKEFEEALRLDPENAPARENLERLKRKMEKEK